MMHPHTELYFFGGVMGFGVVATRFLPKGTITWARDELDLAFTPPALATLPAALRSAIERWVFRDARDNTILAWDHGRFVNHSCDPNCSGQRGNFEIAIRDIHAGEQLTDDYGHLRAWASFACQCGSAVCRGTILHDGTDLARYGEAWDARVREAFPRIAVVDQPLWECVSSADKEAIARALGGAEVPA